MSHVNHATKLRTLSSGRQEALLGEIAVNHKPPNCLLPLALKQFTEDEGWYSTAQVRGELWLGNLMKRLSSAVKLSEMYTNHCVRATVVTKLHEGGMSNTNIRVVTGRRATESVERYKRINSESAMKAASDVLAKVVRSDTASSSKAAPAF